VLVLTAAIQVEGFLRKMAEDVDMKSLKEAEKTLKSIPNEDEKRPFFQPMRRKMHLQV